MPANIVLGLQWGDEGKGKLVDVFSERHQLVCRFQGGPNAGHTIIIGADKYVLHQIPSGIFHPETACLIGNGVVLDPLTLRDELRQLAEAGIDYTQRLLIARRAHLILPSHRQLDRAHEAAMGSDKIGSTQRGISPAYQDKYARAGLRAGDILRPDFDGRLEVLLRRHQQTLDWLGSGGDAHEGLDAFREAVEAMKSLPIIDGERLLHDSLQAGEDVLIEGAQGTLLDVDFGAYPYVTSSNTIAGAACTGLGMAPSHLRGVIGVFKAYCTRVGNGPFPTELDNEDGQELRDRGGEYGATTGRPRRTGWLDLPALRYAIMLNGVNALAITKVDVLTGLPEIKVCTHYLDPEGHTWDMLPADDEDAGMLAPQYCSYAGWPAFDPATDAFPPQLEAFLRFLEESLGVPIRYVSLGPSRSALRLRSPEPAG